MRESLNLNLKITKNMFFNLSQFVINALLEYILRNSL